MTAIEIRFSQKPRGGLISLWVNDLNIWDLKKEECTEEVLKAIQGAVERGILIHQTAMREAAPRIPYIRCNGEFEERK